jgi:hypothetical protein
MRERYVEEQMFSDKIRQTSTWWTWALMSTHLILFIVVQFVLEPRKRVALYQEIKNIIQDSNDKSRDILSSSFNSKLSPDVNSCPPLGSPEQIAFNRNSNFWLGMVVGSFGSFFIFQLIK